MESSRKHIINFVLYEIGRSFSIFSIQVIQFSIITYFAFSTISGFIISFIYFSFNLPNLLISPTIGSLIDNWNKKKVLILTEFFRLIFIIAIIYSISLRIFHIFFFIIIFLFLGIIGACQQPVVFIIIPRLGNSNMINRFNAIDSLLNGIIFVISPLFSAFSIEMLSLSKTIWITLFLIFVTIISYNLLRIREENHQNKKNSLKEVPFKKKVKEGLKYLKKNYFLSFIFCIFLLNFLMRPFGDLISLFIIDLNLGSLIEIGFLVSFFYFGMFLSSSLVSLIDFKASSKLVLITIMNVFISSLIFSIAALTFSPLIIIAYSSIGFFVGIINIYVNSIFHIVVPKKMHGITMSYTFTGATGFVLLSELIYGGLSEIIPIIFIYFVNPIIGIIIIIFVFQKSNKLKLLDKRLKEKYKIIYGNTSD